MAEKKRMTFSNRISLSSSITILVSLSKNGTFRISSSFGWLDLIRQLDVTTEEYDGYCQVFVVVAVEILDSH